MSETVDAQSATDRLRAMLDERGVEWTQGMAWNVTVINGDWLVVEDVDFGTLSVSTTTYQLTPEQAIAATLGSEPKPLCVYVLRGTDPDVMPSYGGEVNQILGIYATREAAEKAKSEWVCYCDLNISEEVVYA